MFEKLRRGTAKIKERLRNIPELWKLGAAMGVLLAVMLPGTMLLSRQQAAEAVLETEILPVSSWGLSFREDNRPPVADASAEDLAVYDAKYIGDTEEKTVYLTFDCGYENGNTAKILDVLRAHSAPAAFFVVGHFLESAPELVARMAEEGHIVGNHTWSHPDMSSVTSREAFARQLQQVRDAYYEITGAEMPKYYRPPMGVYSRENLEMAQELGYRTVFWSLAYVDWKADAQPGLEEAADTLNRRIHGGAVVLLHNTSSTNAAVLDQVLTAWEEMGYSFGTLDGLFGDG